MSFTTEIAEEIRNYFTEKEILELKASFKHYDKNGNGRIDAEELDLVMQDMGMRLTSDQLQEILNDADLDGNGEMDLNEFLLAMKGLQGMKGEMSGEEVIKALSVFTNENGEIDIADLRFHLTHLGECPLQDRDVDELFDNLEMDTLVNKSVDLATFVYDVMGLKREDENFLDSVAARMENINI